MFFVNIDMAGPLDFVYIQDRDYKLNVYEDQSSYYLSLHL